MSYRDRNSSSIPDRIDTPPSNRDHTLPDASPSGKARHGIGIVLSVDGRIFREGLAALLEGQPDFCVLGKTASPAETLTLCVRLQPDVLLLGNLAAGPQNPASIATIRLVSPQTRVLALAPHGRDRCAYLNPTEPLDDDDEAFRGATHAACLPKALAGGATGALDGDADPATLFAAIRALARGETWGAEIAAQRNGSGNGHTLSPQELKVARLVGQGASNKEIAAALEISDLTVKKHVGSIFQKLELNDRLQLGLRVARNPTAFEDD